MSEIVRKDDSAVGITRRAFVLFFALLPGWILVALPVQIVAARVDEWIMGGPEPFQGTLDPTLPLRVLVILLWRTGIWSALALPLIRAAAAAEAGAPPNVWPYILAVNPGRIVRVAWSGLVVMVSLSVGMILLVFPGIYLGLRLSLAPITAAVSDDEDIGLGASWKLARGHLLFILGVVVLVLLGQLALSSPFWIVMSMTQSDLVDGVATAITSCLGEVTTIALLLVLVHLQGRSASSVLAQQPVARSTSVFE